MNVISFSLSRLVSFFPFFRQKETPPSAFALEKGRAIALYRLNALYYLLPLYLCVFLFFSFFFSQPWRKRGKSICLLAESLKSESLLTLDLIVRAHTDNFFFLSLSSVWNTCCTLCLGYATLFFMMPYLYSLVFNGPLPVG